MRNLLKSFLSGLDKSQMQQRPKAQLNLEALEDRTVPSGTGINGFNDDREFFDEPDPNLLSTGNIQSDFIRNLYLTELGRDASPAEVNVWLPILTSGGPAAVANGIDASPEAIGRRINTFFVEFLGRPAAAGDIAALTPLLTAGTITEESVLAGILGSNEFFAVANREFGTTNDFSSFIRGLYQFALDRGASDGEVRLYQMVGQTQSRTTIAAIFVTSVEFRSGATDEFYNVFLDRGADNGEQKLWANTPLTIQQVRVNIASSNEFFLQQ